MFFLALEHNEVWIEKQSWWYLAAPLHVGLQNLRYENCNVKYSVRGLVEEALQQEEMGADPPHTHTHSCFAVFSDLLFVSMIRSKT